MESHIIIFPDLLFHHFLFSENRKNTRGQKYGIFVEMDPLEEEMPPQMGLAPNQKYETVSLVLDDEWLNAVQVF